MRSLFAFALIAVSISGSSASDLPVVNVPQAKIPVDIDGKVAEAEWADAAVVKRFYEEGQELQARPGTMVYLKRDAGRLLFAFVCEEPEKNRPPARKAEPILQAKPFEDAVMLALGQPGSGGQKINFGGYAGASDRTLAPLSLLTQYFINRAGAIGRTVEQSPVREAGFEAVVHEGDGFWSVEGAIPLASASIDPEQTPLVYANFVRLRPPSASGWYVPGLTGPYDGFPVGRMEFLPAEQSEKRTFEELRFLARTDKPGTERPSSGGPLRLKYYPLAGKVIGELLKPDPKSHAKLRLTSPTLGTVEADVDPQNPETVLELAVQPVGGTVHEATLQALNAEGGAVASESFTLQAVDATKRPEWAGTQAGIDYLTKKIPPPWTKPEIDGRTIRLVHGSLRIGDYGLPDSLITAGKEMLAGPVRFLVGDKQEEVRFTPQSLTIEPDGLQVRIHAVLTSGGTTLEVRTRVEFDGFLEVKMRILTAEPDAVDRLTLEIPVVPSLPVFMNFGTIQRTVKIGDWDYSGPAAHWIGSHTQGIGFGSDDPVFRGDGNRQLEFVRRSEATDIHLNFLDAAGQLKESGEVFRFFLQPTPTKPMPTRALADSWDLWFEEWSDYQSYPDLKKLPEVLKRSEAAAAKGHKLILYSHHQLAENAPDFQTFRNDIVRLPETSWYRRASGTGKGVPCYMAGVHGAYGDLLLWGHERLVKEGKIGGIYMDGTSVPWGGNNNPVTPETRVGRKLAWEGDSPSLTVSTRNFLKRLRGIFADGGSDPIMVAHTGSGVNVFTLSFSDVFYEGETLSVFRRGYAPSEAEFVLYGGWPLGLRGSFLDGDWLKGRGPLHALTYTLLHDARMNSIGIAASIKALLGGLDAVEFFPFWDKQPHLALTAPGPDVKMSYYRSPQGILAVVSNLGDTRQTAGLAVLEEAGEARSATDVFDGAAADLKQFPIEPGRLRVFLIADKQPRQEGEIIPIESFSESQWVLVPPSGGASLVAMEEPDGKAFGHLGSTIYRDAATVEFQPADGSTRFFRGRLRHGGRFAAELAGVRIAHDSGQWTLGGADAGALRAVGARPNEWVDFEISISDSHVDIAYAGVPLVLGAKLHEPENSGGLRLSTWGGDSLDIEALATSPSPVTLFAPEVFGQAARVLWASPVKPLSMAGLVPDAWALSGPGASIRKGAIQLDSQLHAAASSAAFSAGEFSPDFADIALAIHGVSNRISISIGNITLTHDSGWRVNGPVSGWNVGQVHQIDVAKFRDATLYIGLRNGLLRVTLGDEVLVEDVAVAMPPAGNKFSIQTWGGDKASFTPVTLRNIP